MNHHDHAAHTPTQPSPKDAAHEDHSGHGAMHEGHLPLMRQRFWLCLALTVPVLLYSQAIQTWFGFTMPVFPGRFKQAQTSFILMRADAPKSENASAKSQCQSSEYF